MSKARINFWLDVVIGIAFLFSAISGLVFLLPVNSAGILGIGYKLWSDLHTWSSLVMIVGVVAHVALHWKWIVAMIKRTLRPTEKQVVTTPAPVLVPERYQGRKINRRDFLYLGGIATAAIAFVAAGYKTLLAPESVETSGDVPGDRLQPEAVLEPTPQTIEPTSQAIEPTPQAIEPAPQVIEPTPQAIEPTPQTAGVACPFGIVNDPFPGRCRRYTDANGDGICDYSVPGSGGASFK